MTKIMTSIIAFDLIKNGDLSLDEKFTISEMMKAGFYINIIGIVVVTIFAAFVLPIVL